MAGVGGSATFEVLPSYLAGMSYQWRFNGNNIPGAMDLIHTIANVALGDAGSYDVVIANDSGTITSDPAQLTVVSQSFGNGGFENGFAQWTRGGNLAIASGPFYVPAEGVNLVAFNNGNRPANGVLSQSFVTTPGMTYLLSFDMGVLAYNTDEQLLKVDLYGNAVLHSATYPIRGIGGGKTQWVTHDVFFTADSTATTLYFTDVSTKTNSIDLLLDNVWLEAVLDGFSLIPAGSFQMGDTIAEGDSDELPVHEVFVSSFYMAKHEVTKALWDEVRTWGASLGYTDLPAGGGKAADHPVQSIDWFAMVKWCNARSEKDGLTPCYTASGTVYRTGSSAPDCAWSANGYRLPTEAEWEKAARGGMSEKRFPWGNVISQSHANYRGDTASYVYDLGPNGYHPTYATGGYPYTSPADSFPANGYGLYSMSGNVWERCWDWYLYNYYASSLTTDPRGPASGADRMIRGGGWDGFAVNCRVANRFNYLPGSSNSNVGFRVARSSVP
jgi:formylglycine-generating enzyme required for sulfatase activity